MVAPADLHDLPLALDAEPHVVAGWNMDGQLGRDDCLLAGSPVVDYNAGPPSGVGYTVPLGDCEVFAVGAGDYHTCVVVQTPASLNKELRCWGMHLPSPKMFCTW